MDKWTQYYAAMYVSEIWYAWWKERGSLHGKARAMVVFDRVMAGELTR